MTLFTALFPNVRDNTGLIADGREIFSIGAGGAAAAVVAKTIGATAIATNPVGAFVYCAIAATAHKLIHLFLTSTINLHVVNAHKEIKASLYQANSAIAKVGAIATTAFIIASFAPKLALGTVMGLLTCTAALSFNALFDVTFHKLRGGS